MGTSPQRLEVATRTEEASSDSGLEGTGVKLVYLAAERTLMAWIRTALATMAFGFVVDRFDVFLRRSGVAPPAGGGTFELLGTPLVAVGAIFATVGAARYLAFAVRFRETQEAEMGRGLLLGAVFAFLLAGLGAILAVLLLTVND